MKNTFSAIVIIVAIWHAELSAQEYAFGSALTQSVAGAVALVPHSPSVSSTCPALLGFAAPKSSAELSYRQLFGLGEMEDFALHASHRMHRASGGLSVTRFGQSGLYQEYSLSGALAYRFRLDLTAGVGLQYTSAEFGEGDSRYAGADLVLSVAYRPVTSLLVSSAIRRLDLDRIYDSYVTDPVYEVSLAWASPSEVSLGAIWTREGPGDHRFALGQILNLTENLDFLAGLRFDPIRYTLGGRALYRGMSLAYAYEGHSDLGATHSFGLGWGR